MGGTRRQFLIGGAAAAGAVYASACMRREASPGSLNVLVVIVDTLRVDHSYGPRARTPNIDALAARGLRFIRAFPEAMPTVPARNSMLSGRRMFPFRDWQDQSGLLAKPDWAPEAEVASMFTSVLRRAGWWTGYVTDNPFVGFARPYEPLRRSFDLFTRHGGQIGGEDWAVPPEALARWLHPAVIEAGWASGCIATSRTPTTPTTKAARSPRGSSARGSRLSRLRAPSVRSLSWSTPTSRTSRGLLREATPTLSERPYRGPEPAHAALWTGRELGRGKGGPRGAGADAGALCRRGGDD